MFEMLANPFDSNIGSINFLYVKENTAAKLIPRVMGAGQKQSPLLEETSNRPRP